AVVRILAEGRTRRETSGVAGISPGAFDRVAERTFGVLVFAPLAVKGLEERVSGAEIVRYPGSPYEIVRPYWENMAAVARRLSAEQAPLGAEAFVRFLSQLHVLALRGEDGRSVYRPASPIVEKQDLQPGVLYPDAPRTASTEGGVRFVSGPRVNAGPIGGDVYQALLVESVGGPQAASPAVEVRDASGLSWGGVVTA